MSGYFLPVKQAKKPFFASNMNFLKVGVSNISKKFKRFCDNFVLFFEEITFLVTKGKNILQI